MKYKLNKNGIPNVIMTVFPETLKSTAGFVMSSVATGCVYGPIYNMPVQMNNVFTTSETNALLAVGIFSSFMLARQVYKNFKKERGRLHELAEAIDKEKMQRKMANLEEERQLEESGLVQTYVVDSEDGILKRR